MLSATTLKALLKSKFETEGFPTIGDLDVDTLKALSESIVDHIQTNKIDGASLDGLANIVAGAGIIPEANLPDTLSTKAYVNEMLMIGSENARYVPCSFSYTNRISPDATEAPDGEVTNTTANEPIFLLVDLPLPTTLGDKKLYITRVKTVVSDADSNNFVTNTYTYGMNGAGGTVLDTDTTDYNSVDEWVRTYSSPIDCSAYFTIRVKNDCNCDAAYALEISSVLIECYYDD